jgi:hypothetical protein
MSGESGAAGQPASEMAEAQRAAEERMKAFGVIESDVPGRVRLRLKRELRSPELMNALQERLQANPGVHKVTVNHRTGSFVIHFDKHLTVHDVTALDFGALDEQAAAEQLKIFGVVEERVPGRIQLHLKPQLRTASTMKLIEERLEQDPLIENVTVDQPNGTIVIEFAKSEAGKTLAKSALREAELVAATLFELPEGEEGGGGGYGKLDQQLADLIYRADKAVYKRTGLRFRGQIIAGGLAGLGVAQIAIYGIGLELLPGPLLLWIAWDIYHRESKEPPLDALDDVAAPVAGAPAPAAA